MVFGFLFAVAMAVAFYFHPEIYGRNLPAIAVLSLFCLLFGALAIMSVFHPEWTDWNNPYGGDLGGGDGGGGTACGGDAGSCGDSGGGGH